MVHAGAATAAMVAKGDEEGISLGKVAIQDISDCDVGAICETVRKLAAIEFDTLLPGHHGFTLKDGRRHADLALQCVNRVQIPPSIL